MHWVKQSTFIETVHQYHSTDAPLAHERKCKQHDPRRPEMFNYTITWYAEIGYSRHTRKT